jgi:hypothetical protein
MSHHDVQLILLEHTKSISNESTTQKHRTTTINDDTITELQISPGNENWGPIFNNPYVNKISKVLNNLIHKLFTN